MFIAIVTIAMLVSCNKEGVDETVTDITTSFEI